MQNQLSGCDIPRIVLCLPRICARLSRSHSLPLQAKSNELLLQKKLHDMEVKSNFFLRLHDVYILGHSQGLVSDWTSCFSLYRAHFLPYLDIVVGTKN